MKRLCSCLLGVSLLLALAVSCTPDDTVVIDPQLMSGLWVKNGTHEYWRYNADGSGVTWDTAEDVLEEEGIKYTWQLSGTSLTIVFQGEMGEVVPKLYTMTELSPSRMGYKDIYGNMYIYDRQ